MPDSTNVAFPDDLVDVVLPDESGYEDPKGEDNSEEFAMMGAREFPDSLWIEPSEWKDRARENDKYGLWAESVRNRFTNQSPTHECTCHSLVQGAEAAWNQTRKGKGHPVLFSPLSVYAEANPRERGGANCRHVLSIAINRGFIPDHASMTSRTGQQEIFKHTLHGTTGKGNATQTKGPWTAVSRFPEGWQQTARHFKPNADDCINPRSFEQAMCLLLHGRVVNVGRNGHAVPWNRIVWRDGRLYVAYSDSYDVIRYDSERTAKGAIGGASCIWQMTVPADWDKPAGEDQK